MYRGHIFSKSMMNMNRSSKSTRNMEGIGDLFISVLDDSEYDA